MTRSILWNTSRLCSTGVVTCVCHAVDKQGLTGMFHYVLLFNKQQDKDSGVS